MAIKGAEGYKVAEGQELEQMNKLSDNLNSIISGTGSEGGKEPVVITGVITFGELTWNNQKASVTINKTTTDSLSIEYQVLNHANQEIVPYTAIANGGTVSNLNLGEFVIARLTDGQNHGNSASLEVTDGDTPTAPTFGTPSGEKKNESGWYTGNVTVGVIPGTDEESGVAKTTYSITGAGAKAETEGTSVTISAEGTSVITAYTYDNAGHKTASATTLTIKIDKTPPPTATLTVSEKTGNTVKVTTAMSSTNDISGIAKYIFEYKKSTEADTAWKTAKEGTTRPSTYTYTGLEKGTAYNFRVKTQDNAGNIGTGSNVNETTESYEDPMNPNVDGTYAGLVVDYKPKEGQVYNTQDLESTTRTNGVQFYNGYDFGYVQSDTYKGTWKIWGTDDAYIYVISTEPAPGLALYGMIGYNNGVTLLDNVCDRVYTNKIMYPESKGQCLKVEQILSVATSENAVQKLAWEPVYDRQFPFAYPQVYVQHENTPQKWRLNRSKSYGLLSPSEVNSGSTSENVGNSRICFGTDAIYAASDYIAPVYRELILRPTIYWISTRQMEVSGNNAFWMLGVVGDGQIGGDWLANYVYETGYHDQLHYRPLRPIISFPTSTYRLDTSTTPAKIVKK